MSQKQRLKQLEKKANSQFLAFFALPRGLCNRKEVELQLWNDYVKNGGNRAATPAFLPQWKEDAAWRQFSIMDQLWLYTIKALREFGLPLDRVKNAKDIFFTPIENFPFSIMEYYGYRFKYLD